MIYIYKSIVNIKTLISLFIALFFLYIFNIFGVINYSMIDHEISRYFWMIILFALLWSYIELILKKNIRYLFFLYLMLIPLFDFIASKNTLSTLSVGYFIINYHLIFLIIFSIKLLILKDNYRFISSYSKEIFLFYIAAFFALLSVISSKSSFMALNGLIYIIVVPLMIIFISNYVSKTDKKYNDGLVYKMLIFSLIFYSSISVLYSLNTLIFSGFGNSNNRLLGLYSGNMLGLNFIIIMGLSLQFYNIHNKKKYLSIILFSLIGVLLTGSRGTLILSILLISIYYLLYVKFLSYKIFLKIITVLIIIVFSGLIFNSYFELIGYNRLLENGLSSGRFETWSNSIDYIFQNNLFLKGNGIGNYMLTAYGKISRLTSAHNSFLHLSIEIGVIGSIFYFIAIMKNLLMVKLNKDDMFLKILLLIIIMFGLGIGAEPLKYNRGVLLSNGYFVNSLDLNIRFVYLWMVIGFIHTND